MLGFSAIGELALGQPPAGLTFQLVAAVGSFLLTGQATNLNVTQPSAVGAYSLTGAATPFKVNGVETAGVFSLSGAAASFSPTLGAVSGAYTLSGASSFTVTAPESSGSFALTGIASSFRVSLAPATGPYSLTGIAIAPNAPGAYSLTGKPQTFSVVETNLFSRTVQEQVGFAALGELPLGGAFASITDPAFIVTGRANLQTSFAVSPGGYTVAGPGVVWQFNTVTGAFSLTGKPATFGTTWTGLGAGVYFITGSAAGGPEQWVGRPDPIGIWTNSINDTGTETVANAHFLFAPLGALALGQGVYNPRLFSESWTVRTKTTEIWTPIINDVAA